MPMMNLLLMIKIDLFLYNRLLRDNRFFKINKSYKSGKGKSKCVKSYVINEGSLVIMRPGSQKTLNHCVRTERTSGECQVRYSIHHSSPSTVPVTDTGAARGTTSPSTQNQHKKKICLVAGDYLAVRLDVLKLGKQKRDVRRLQDT